MKFGPIEIKDKSNRTIVLRNATPEDAEDPSFCLYKWSEQEHPADGNRKKLS